MAARTIFARLPITTSFAARRTPTTFARFNSSSSTTRASRIVEIASQAEKPNAMEAAVPVMWVVSGALIYTAFQRVPQNETESVEKLIIV